MAIQRLVILHPTFVSSFWVDADLYDYPQVIAIFFGIVKTITY